MVIRLEGVLDRGVRVKIPNTICATFNRHEGGVGLSRNRCRGCKGE